MSDNLKRYRAIKAALTQLYPSEVKGHLARDLNVLAALLSGIVGSRSSQLPSIAAKIPGPTHVASRAKACSRWINDADNDYEAYFLPFAQNVLTALASGPLVFILDSSAVGRRCLALMVNVLYQGRALPIAWVVYKGNKGHLPECTHVMLLESVLALLPAESDVIVLGDGEFDGIELQATVAAYGGQYVCRTAQNTLLVTEDEVLSYAALGVQPGQCLSVSEARFSTQRYGPVLAIAWWRRGCQEPLYLVSNCELPEEACAWYGKRFRIETFFSDQKSRGFNLHKSHLTDPLRLARLMIATCLAYLWIIYLGVVATQDGWLRFLHRADRCDLSLFQLGLRLLDHFLESPADIPVTFQVE